MNGIQNILTALLNNVKINASICCSAFLNKKLKLVLVMLKSKCGYKKAMNIYRYLYAQPFWYELSGSCISFF